MRHLEDDLQMACVKWFDFQHPMLKALLFHVPNGGHRNAREAARFKAMGVRPGVPDLLLLYPKQGFHFLALELKAGKNTQTYEQKRYESILTNRAGGKYVVIRSIDGFIEAVSSYLEG